MFCRHCGMQHHDSDVFCRKCGKSLRVAASPQVVQPTYVPQQPVYRAPQQSSIAAQPAYSTAVIDTSHMSNFSNPTFREGVFEKMQATGRTMTIQGAINKTLILLSVLLTGALISWSAGFSMWGSVTIFSVIGFVLALVVSFVPTTAPYLSIVYALFEGLALGALSNLFEWYYPGIAAQAVIDTIVIAATMLFFYKTGLIQVTDKFKSIVIGATVGICLAQLVILILHLFGIYLPFLYDGGWLSVLIGIVIVGVAAFNLALDFQFFKEGEEANLPSYCEWYAGFGLIVTLVWLYVSILRLLAILNDD